MQRIRITTIARRVCDPRWNDPQTGRGAGRIWICQKRGATNVRGYWTTRLNFMDSLSSPFSWMNTMSTPISFDEASRIKYLRRQGLSYHKIGRDVGRNPASCLRICTGERGALMRQKAWRCGGCGAMICKPKCLGCQMNQMRFIKRSREGASRWSTMINDRTRMTKKINKFL